MIPNFSKRISTHQPFAGTLACRGLPSAQDGPWSRDQSFRWHLLLTTIGHFPASNPHTALIISAWKGVAPCNKMKTEKGQAGTETHAHVTSTKPQERGPAPSRWDSLSSTTDPANIQENNCRIHTIITTETSHVHLRTRQLDDTFRTQTNSDLPDNYQRKDSNPSNLSRDVELLRTLPKCVGSGSCGHLKYSR